MLLEEYLRDTSTTPEMALKSLSTPFSIPGTCGREEIDFDVIFLSHVMFIMRSQPEGNLHDIWEDIFKKTISYSKNISVSQVTHMMNQRPYNIIIHTEPRVRCWLNEALSTPTKCPDPYIRLELFRLIRIFREEIFGYLDWKRICATFMHIISEIQPHHLLPSGGEYEVMFRLADLKYIIEECGQLDPNITKIISSDIIQQIKSKNISFVDSKETLFLCHCIQLIGVFVVLTNSTTSPRKQLTQITECCRVLNGTISNLVNCSDDLPGIILSDQFRYVTSHLPFHHYLEETLHDLTSAIFKNNLSDNEKWVHLIGMGHLNYFNQDISNKTFNFRSLLDRQIQGFTLAHYRSCLTPMDIQCLSLKSLISVERDSHKNIHPKLFELLNYV